MEAINNAGSLLKEELANPRSKTKLPKGYKILRDEGLLDGERLLDLTLLTSSSIAQSEGRTLTGVIRDLGVKVSEYCHLNLGYEDSLDVGRHLLESAHWSGLFTYYLGEGGNRLTLIEGALPHPIEIQSESDKSTSIGQPFSRWSTPIDHYESGRAIISNYFKNGTSLDGLLPDFTKFEREGSSWKATLGQSLARPLWLQGIDRLESQAFQINADILKVAKSIEAKVHHTGATSSIRKAKTKKFSKTLKRAEVMLETGQPFFRRINADYRGRLNDASAFIAHSGDDIQRALVEFHDSVEIGDSNDYLWLHMANVMGLKGSMSDRIKSAKRLQGQIRLWSRTPEATFENGWGSYENKFQVLRAAMELDHSRTRGMTRLPVALDQNASVYQHIALLYRNPELAKLSNLGEDYQSIYHEIARQMETDIIDDDLNLRAKVVKAVCMPRAYGGTSRSAEKGLRALSETVPQLAELMEEAKASEQYEAHRLSDSLTLKNGETITIERDEEFDPDINYDWIDDDGNRYLNVCKPRSRGSLYSKQISLAFKGLIEATTKALEIVVPDEKLFLEQISSIAFNSSKSNAQDGSVKWLSPSGFPVVIKRFQEKKYRLRLRLKDDDGQIKFLDLVAQRRGGVSPKRTASASVPAVVHSLDASVLHHVAVKFNQDLPLTCNHDSFATLAPHCKMLQEQLSDSLIWAHSDDELGRITEALGDRVEIGSLLSPSDLVKTTVNAFN